MSRDLDALVAEKVMGWTEVERISREMSQTDIGPVGWFGRPPLPSTPGQRIPEFSSDIAAAWQVVEKMVDLGWHPKITGRFSGPTDPWWAGFTAQNCTGWNGRPDYAASDPDSLPTAICLAALRTVGVPVPETP